jgi:AraC-like DNA-binding protein
MSSLQERHNSQGSCNKMKRPFRWDVTARKTYRPIIRCQATCPLLQLGSDGGQRITRLRELPSRAENLGYSPRGLALSFGCTLRTLERTLTAATGTRPRDCILCLRAMRAPKLLRGGSSVKQTATVLGFSSRSHFSREFKRWYGVAPKALTRRRDNRGSVR